MPLSGLVSKRRRTQSKSSCFRLLWLFQEVLHASITMLLILALSYWVVNSLRRSLGASWSFSGRSATLRTLCSATQQRTRYLLSMLWNFSQHDVSFVCACVFFGMFSSSVFSYRCWWKYVGISRHIENSEALNCSVCITPRRSIIRKTFFLTHSNSNVHPKCIFKFHHKSPRNFLGSNNIRPQFCKEFPNFNFSPM